MSARIPSLNDFLALLKGVKRVRDGQNLALCPGHHDTKPSLSVKEADGKILVQCFAGCELNDILKPLGLEPQDLFLNSRRIKHRCVNEVYQWFEFWWLDDDGDDDTPLAIGKVVNWPGKPGGKLHVKFTAVYHLIGKLCI